MTDPENFVSRWSRLKRSFEKGRRAEPTDGAPLPSQDDVVVAQPRADAPASSNFDPAILPPIDLIAADTDIRAFLQSGVPAALTRAALRSAWVKDPAIRDFIGIAENQWDFNDPAAIPGFAPLRDTDDVPRLVAHALGSLGKSATAVAETRVSPGEALSVTPASQQTPGVTHENRSAGVAAEHEPLAAENGNQGHRRQHGTALPQ